jgi:hypothetical protein
MQRVLHKVCEDSQQNSKLHCVRQNHRGLRDSDASDCADKQRPASATNDEGKTNKASKSSVPEAGVGIWRFRSSSGFFQLRFRIS